MSQDQTVSVPFSKKRWPKVIAVFVLLVVGFLVALPYAIRYSLEQWLVNNGAHSAEIKKVRLNLFTGTAGIDGLQIKLDDNVVLGDDNIHLDFELSSLIKKEGHLKTGKLSGLIVDVELSADGSLRIGSISTAPSLTASPSTAAPEEPVESKDISWLFRVGNVELKDCLVRFSMPKLHKTIHVDHAALSNLTTGISSQPAHLELQGHVNDTPLTLELDRIDLNPEIVVGGHIKIDGYELENLKELLQNVLDPFSGSVALDGKVQFSMSDQGDIGAKYDGTIELDKPDIGSSDFSTTSPSISYNGTVHYEQNTNLDIEIEVNGLLKGDDINVGVPVANLDLIEKHLQLDGKTLVTITNGIAVATDATLSLTEFNLDLPPLNATHSGLNWQGHVEYDLNGDSGNQRVSTDGELALMEPTYGSESKDFPMHTDAKQLSWQGLVDVNIGSGDDPIAILVDGLINGDSYQLVIPDLLDLKEDGVLAEGKTEITIGHDIKVSSRGRQVHTGTSVTAAGTRNSGSLSWQGHVDYLLKDNTSEVLLDGTLKGTELASLLEEQKISIKQKDINTTAKKVSLKIGERIRIGGKASLTADKLQVENDGSPLLQLDKTAVHGLTGTAKGGLQVDTVTLSSLEVPATETQPIAVSIPEITLKNIASTDFVGATVDTLQIKQPTVRDTKNTTLLARMDTITANAIQVDQPVKFSVATVSTGKGTFLEKDGKKTKPQVTLGKLKIKEVSWSSDDGLLCNQVILDSLFADFTRVKSTESNKTQKTEPGQKKNQEKTVPPAVQIDSIAVTGNSGFTFADKATTVPFQTTLILETAEIKNINLSNPKTPFTYKVKGKFDDYSPLDISGSCTPFAEKFLVESKFNLRNYSLQQLSPYVIDAIGTKFVSGQMNVTSELNITGDTLDLDNNLVFQQAKAETVREELLEKLNNELPVSLDMALSMLRDKKGDIDLDVPVSGTLSDLNVNTTDIIVTALSKAIVIGVTPYLAYTLLGPAGALAYVGLKAGEAVIDIGLPSLEFENGQSELTDDHKETLKSVGKHIEDDKDQYYSVCSKVVVWELSENIEKNVKNQQEILDDESMRNELLAISGTRADNVHKYLTKKFSIDEEHLLICPPSINFEPEGKASVSFRK